MTRALGWFDPELDPRAWFDASLIPEAWFDVDLIPSPLALAPFKAFAMVRTDHGHPKHDHDADAIVIPALDFLALAVVVAAILQRRRNRTTLRG